MTATTPVIPNGPSTAALEHLTGNEVPKPVGTERSSSLGAILSDVYDEHRLIILMSAVYVAAGGAVLTALHRPWPMRVTYPLFAGSWIALSLGYLAFQWCLHPSRFRAAVAPRRVLGALFVALLLAPVQITFQSLKLSIGYLVGFPWDPLLSQVDRALHAGPAWHWIAFLFDYPRIMQIGLLAYERGWVFVSVIFVFWLAWSPDREFRKGALVAVLLIWIVGGTLGAFVFASAGPCYSSEPWYREQITQFDAIDFEVANTQRAHWRAQLDQRWHPFVGVSAFPSMHVAMAALMFILTWPRSRIVGFCFGIFAAFVQVWSVVLAWHYAIDGYAAFLIAWACWRWAGALTEPAFTRSSANVTYLSPSESR